MTDWIFSVVDQLGAPGVGLLLLLENLIPPVPSEVVLSLAGFRSRTGSLNVVTVWPAATLGSLLGALILYGLGGWLGYDRLCRVAERKWFILVSSNDLERGRQLLERHGSKVVVVARFVPVIRSVVSIPAGVARMPLRRFLLLTLVGSGLWNAAFIWFGWMLGEHWNRVQDWVTPVTYSVVGLCIVGLLVTAIRRNRSRHST